MRFVLFTPLTVGQSMSALHDRLHSKAAGRPALDGWVEKNGRFALSHSSRVGGRFRRSTRLEGVAAKEDGLTVIRGHVPEGVARDGLLWIAGALVAACLLLLVQGQVLPGVALLGLGAVMVIPLAGDHSNHAVLLAELEKTLKAKPTPPKARAGVATDVRARRAATRAKPTSTRRAVAASAKPKTATTRPASAKPSAKPKPAPSAKTTGTTPRVPTAPAARTPSRTR